MRVSGLYVHVSCVYQVKFIRSCIVCVSGLVYTFMYRAYIWFIRAVSYVYQVYNTFVYRACIRFIRSCIVRVSGLYVHVSFMYQVYVFFYVCNRPCIEIAKLSCQQKHFVDTLACITVKFMH